MLGASPCTKERELCPTANWANLSSSERREQGPHPSDSQQEEHMKLELESLILLISLRIYLQTEGSQKPERYAEQVKKQRSLHG